jgi:hypothetical protein
MRRGSVQETWNPFGTDTQYEQTGKQDNIFLPIYRLITVCDLEWI